MLKKIVFGTVAFLVVVAVGGCVALSVLSDPRPTGTTGADADALARRVQDATGVDAWQKTGAVRFQQSERSPKHLWDRSRGLLSAGSGYRVVLLRLADKSGLVFESGERKDDQKAVESAWARFINDSFWLFPFDTFFHDGVKRSVVDTDEGRALLIEYGAGGVTPGDAYLWVVGDDGRPIAWRMWVQILPLAGMRVGWSDWKQLPTGAWIAYEKSGAGLTMRHQAEGAATLAELVGGEDPFAPLFDSPAPAASAPAADVVAPASQPAATATATPAAPTAEAPGSPAAADAGPG